MIKEDNCILCGQVMYPPLLEEYQTTCKEKQEKMIEIIKESIIEAYDDKEEAEIFAIGLVGKLKNAEII